MCSPALALFLVLTACDACPSVRPPAFSSCDPPCDAPLVVSIRAEPDAEPFFRCEGFPATSGPSDPCAFATGLVLSSWAGGGDADLVAATPPTILGYAYRLELEARDGGRARLCRILVSDSVGQECPPSDWSCADEGEAILTAGGGGQVRASFANGATIEAAFAGPT